MTCFPDLRAVLAAAPARAAALVFAAVTAVACDSSFVGSLTPSTVPCEVTTSAPQQPMGSAGGNGTLMVSALPECTWRVTPTSNWITSVAPASGQGEQQVTFEVAANPTQQARQAELVINNQRITVSQQAAPAPPPPPPPAPPAPAPPPPPPPSPGPTPPPACTFVLASASATIGAAGGPISFGVTTGATCAWSVQTSAPWITVSSAPTGIGPIVVTLQIAANNGALRTGTVSIGGQVFTVTQASPCTYSISPNRLRVDENGVTLRPVDVTTSAGCAWTAVSNVSWIAVVSGASGTGPGVVEVTVAPNSGGNRTGTVTIAGQTLRVDQDDD